MWLDLFICLLMAHVVSDFYLQTEKTCKDKVERKWRSPHHYIHAAVVFVLSWLVSWDLCFWWSAMIIAVLHLGIDMWKSYREDCIKWFVLDQLLHFVVIGGVVWSLCSMNDWHMPCSMETWIVASSLAVLVCWKPANILIKQILKQCSVHMPEDQEGVFNAGALIGTIERWLILIFVCLQRYDALGLLIAAKSIIRFGDSQTNKSEYVLAGTLLSIFVAVLAGLSVRLIMVR